jgi:hypothetical protein
MMMMQKYEVLSAEYNRYSLYWRVLVRSGDKEWEVLFIHGRGFRDIEWKFGKWENGNWVVHGRGCINLPHHKMVRVYPRTVDDAIKFFPENPTPEHIGKVS